MSEKVTETPSIRPSKLLLELHMLSAEEANQISRWRYQKINHEEPIFQVEASMGTSNCM